MDNKTIKNVPTPHIEAKHGEIAKTVLMPGDPLRAKFIAESFLEDVTCFNKVRNMFGYTGTYKGKKVSVMGSGMGMPSIGIYSYELFEFYGVENIIRVGSCGALAKDLKLFDVILATAAYSDSTFAELLNGYDEKYTYPSERINDTFREVAKKHDIEVVESKIESGDVFYSKNLGGLHLQERVDKGITAVEMESFALFANAAELGKNAACILTVSDSIVNKEVTTPEQREKAFTTMMKLSLETAIQL